MRFKYGMTKLTDKKSVISFMRNLGYSDDIKFILTAIKQYNMNGYRALVLIKD